MNRVYNFSAGPACLPEKALQAAKKAFENFQENHGDSDSKTP